MKKKNLIQLMNCLINYEKYVNMQINKAHIDQTNNNFK